MTKWKAAAAVLALTVAFSGAFAQQKGNGKKGGKGAAKAGGDVAKGKEIFEGKCIVCHNPDDNEKKIGPGLKGVKAGKLPSGKAATHDVILGIVNEGGGGMPAYKELLTDAEKEDVIAFVLTL